jgi:hypothetical protein
MSDGETLRAVRRFFGGRLAVGIWPVSMCLPNSRINWFGCAASRFGFQRRGARRESGFCGEFGLTRAILIPAHPVAVARLRIRRDGGSDAETLSPGLLLASFQPQTSRAIVSRRADMG